MLVGPKGRAYLLLLVRMNHLVVQTIDGLISYRVLQIRSEPMGKINFTSIPFLNWIKVDKPKGDCIIDFSIKFLSNRDK